MTADGGSGDADVQGTHRTVLEDPVVEGSESGAEHCTRPRASGDTAAALVQLVQQCERPLGLVVRVQEHRTGVLHSPDVTAGCPDYEQRTTGGTVAGMLVGDLGDRRTELVAVAAGRLGQFHDAGALRAAHVHLHEPGTAGVTGSTHCDVHLAVTVEVVAVHTARGGMGVRWARRPSGRHRGRDRSGDERASKSDSLHSFLSSIREWRDNARQDLQHASWTSGRPRAQLPDPWREYGFPRAHVVSSIGYRSRGGRTPALVPMHHETFVGPVQSPLVSANES